MGGTKAPSELGRTAAEAVRIHRALLAAMPDTLARVRLDGLVVEVRLSSGLSAPALRERYEGSYFGERMSPAEASHWQKRLRRCLEAGEPQTGRCEWGGGARPRVFELRMVPCAPDEVLVLCRDLTEEVSAKRRVVEANRLLEEVTRSVPCLVYVYDIAARKNVFVNREIGAELGYAPERMREIGDWPFPALMHPDDRRWLPERLAAVLSADDGEVLDVETRLRDASGCWRWYRSRTSIFTRGADGLPQTVFGVLEDLTERRRLEQQVDQAARLDAVGQLASGIAHDFNNLLTAIHGWSELIVGNLPDGHPAHAAAAELESAVERGAAVTRPLLAFSRNQARQPRPIDMALALRDIAPLLRRLLGERIELRLRGVERGASVEMDPVELEQVVVNLAINARDAMPEGGTITLEVDSREPAEESRYSEAHGRVVRLRVRDTGRGIPPSDLPHVFDPFFTTKPAGMGTGLGLPSCRRIVERAGGQIEVESTSGAGTCFSVSLPGTCLEKVTSAVATPAARSGDVDHLVLVVEDDAGIRHLLVETLKRDGYRVLDAEDGSAALALLRSGGASPDLVVSDVIMPGLSGPELVEQLRSMLPELRVLFVSGYADRDALAARAGAGELLRKPFSPATFGKAVRRALAH